METSVPELKVLGEPELLVNNLGSLPGVVYQSQVNSPIRWQQWSKVTLERAKAANRLIFCVIAVPQHPGFLSVLSQLGNDSDLVSIINNDYVPVLIDGDASREIGLLTSDLCAEIKRPVQLPLFVWMTPTGNPVAWIPAPPAGGTEISTLFSESHSMIGRIWVDDPEYVISNSHADNLSRRERIGKRKNTTVMSKQPEIDVLRGIRQMCSLYDPYTRNFDEAGGLFPSGAIDLLSTAAIHPGLSEEVRGRCLETIRELLDDLLPSAMFDPLEGGVFASRRRSSWALPTFSRDCVSQARAAVSLINAYRATGDLRALDKALGVIEFAERSFMTPEGLFAVGLSPMVDTSEWLWSVEEIEKELSAEDAAWWIKVTGMKELGNLASETDPQREFFRENSIGIGKSLPELAKNLAVSPEEFGVRFENARKILLKTRAARIGESVRDDSPHAGATFRMVSAYAAAFAITGEDRFKEKAVNLLTKSREIFSEGPRLRMFSKPAPDSIGAGRAFLYGLALQAVLDVAAISSDEKWLLWSEDLATVAAEQFTGTDLLKECPDSAKIIDLPITDLVMVFDDSSAGLISSAETRLAARGRSLVESFSVLATPLPVYAVDRPILHTDLLQATLARVFEVKIIVGKEISGEMKKAIEMLPLRMIQRVSAKPADGIPSGSVKVIAPGVETRVIATPSELREATLPPATKF